LNEDWDSFIENVEDYLDEDDDDEGSNEGQSNNGTSPSS